MAKAMSEGANASITIKDIARVVGVSPTAVSRALNNYPDVGEETRRRILKVAEEMNYHPNAIARGLVRNKTDTIGLFVLGRSQAGFSDPFAFEVIIGVMEAVSAAGYDLVLFGAGGPGARPISYVKKSRERRVDGVVIMGLRTDDPQLPGLSSLGMPCVLVDVDVEAPGVGFVGSDNIAGAKRAVEYLVSLGHGRIAFLNGHARATVSRERLQGYRLALMESGLENRPDYVVEGDFSAESGRRAADVLFGGGVEPAERPTAVFAASDLMAIGLMQAAREMGLSVPGDLSVVGFDDIGMASMVEPPLTTVRQSRHLLGTNGARLLIEALEKGRAPERLRLVTELVIRGSAGKAPNGKVGEASTVKTLV